MTLENKELADGIRRYMDRFISLNRDYTYIFGHTHKFFQESGFKDSNNFTHELVNCGGWVVEKIDEIPDTHVIKISGEGDIATIRIDIPNVVLEAKYDIIRRALS
jgi:hypothetical protein